MQQTVNCTRCGQPAELSHAVEVEVTLQGRREGTVLQVLCLDCRRLPHYKGALYGVFLPASLQATDGT